MAQKSTHTLIQFGDGVAAPDEAFANIANVSSINGLAITTEAIDTTDLDDDAKTAIPAPYDGGEAAVEIFFEADEASHVEQTTDQLAGNTGNYQICFPNYGARTETVPAASVDVGNDDMTTSTDHDLTTGQPIRFTTSGADLPEPLEIATTYFVIVVDADELQVATTNANAVAGTQITITDQGTGTHTIQIGSRTDWAAFLTNNTPTASVGAAVTASLTFKVTGAVSV